MPKSDFGQTKVVWYQFTLNVQNVRNPNKIVWLWDENLGLKSEANRSNAWILYIYPKCTGNCPKSERLNEPKEPNDPKSEQDLFERSIVQISA